MRRIACCLALLLLAACAPAPAVPTPAPAQPTATPFHADAIATYASSPAATAAVVAAATSVAVSPVQISEATVDPGNFENSSITLHNSGTQPVDLSGWVILVGSYRVKFPTNDYMTLEPAHSKIVHLSSTDDPVSGDNLYLGMGSVSVGTGAVTSGDRIVLVNSQGKVASTYPPP